MTKEELSKLLRRAANGGLHWPEYAGLMRQCADRIDALEFEVARLRALHPPIAEWLRLVHQTVVEAGFTAEREKIERLLLQIDQEKEPIGQKEG